jgi:hypothetical protein
MSEEETPVAPAEGAEIPLEGSDPPAAEEGEITPVAPAEGAEKGGDTDPPQPDPAEKEGETPGNSETSEGEGKNKAKKKIGKLTKENGRLQLELDRLKASQAQPAPTSEPVKEPLQDDFEDYEDYQKAHTQWNVKETIRENDVSKWKESEKQTSEHKAQERQADFEERADTFKETTEDFEKVAKSPEMLRFYSDVPHIAEIVEGNEKGPEIAYYLGNNPNVAFDLARLSPLEAAVEVGKLEAKISKEPKPRAVSQAPTPISPTGGGGQGGKEKAPNEMSDAEFATWRRGFIEKRNK